MTCQRARNVEECTYELADYPVQPTPSTSFTTLPPLGVPDDQVTLHGPARVPSSSRVESPSGPPFLIQPPVPQQPGQLVVRGSVPVRYEFVGVTPRPTLYPLPFRLADIIDPAALPISDSTTSELSMKLCVSLRPHERVTRPLTLLPAASLRYPVGCNWASH